MTSTFTLPYSDGLTVNHCYVWTGRGGGRRLSAHARAWMDEAILIVRAVHAQPGTGDLALLLTVYPPDRRRRDLDNLLKLTVDAVADGLGIDDYRFADLRVRRWRVDRSDPRIEAELSAVEG